MPLIGRIISSSTSEYLVEEILGSGAFGVVALCKKKPTNDFVALKINKNKRSVAVLEEAKALHILTGLGAEEFNIVRFSNSFMDGGLCCLEFEKLDISLSEYTKENYFTLKEIRPIVQQLGEALSFLKRAEFVHADLKPDNIMMVDHVQQPLRVKLIDFGLAHNDPERHTGKTIGTLCFMSPEVLLGIPFNQAIDMWALGCIATEMLTRKMLFPGRSFADMVKLITSLLGQPPDVMVEHGRRAKKYFRIITSTESSSVKVSFIKKLKPDKDPAVNFNKWGDRLLEDHTGTPPEDVPAEQLDRRTFFDLLTEMLKLSPDCRIKPSDMLKHPFLTLSHLDSSSSRYVQQSIKLMEICPHWGVDKEEDAPRCSAASQQPSAQDAKPSGKKRPRDSEECANSSAPQTAEEELCRRAPGRSPPSKRRRINRDKTVTRPTPPSIIITTRLFQRLRI